MTEETNYTEVNRAMWNLTAEINKKEGFSELLSAIKNPEFSSFDAVEKELFTRFPLNGKDVLQIGCNSGQELCSIKRAGAGRCVGIDISDQFIEQAKELAAYAELDIEFICSDVFALENQYQRSFDLVYITVGVLGWMPDLPRLLALIHSWLKPNGQLFIYEQHPILDMFNPIPPHAMDSSYFRKAPFIDEMLPEYIDTEGTGSAPSYWFPHTLSDIIGGCLQQGLQLRHFAEYPNEISVTYAALEQNEARLPLSYSLIAERAEQ
ncbi:MULTISPECIES: class I SAM-dependent methyltransferase [unclassified Iodobacter]